MRGTLNEALEALTGRRTRRMSRGTEQRFDVLDGIGLAR